MISKLTLFFDESQTELAVGLTLTIMLVMYTLYQSINESMTKTAYLKMIDYWLLFCLLTPFTIFIVEVYWLLNKTHTSPNNQNNWIKEANKIFTNRRHCRIIILSFACFFIMSYGMCAVVISNF